MSGRTNLSNSGDPSEKSSIHPDSGEWIQARDSFSSAMQQYRDTRLRFRDTFVDTSLACKSTQNVLETVDGEMKTISLYILELQRIQAAMGTVRNGCRQIAPVNHLPREVLSNIFEIIVKTEYWSSNLWRNVELLQYPNLLSEVCTSWNQLVKSTPVLWSYIDLVISGYQQHKFYARASQFLKFAKEIPLSIRVHALIRPTEIHDVGSLVVWLVPVMKRVRHLSCQTFLSNVLYSVLSCLFEYGAPGSVKELVLFVRDLGAGKLIELNPSEFDVPLQKLQGFLEPLTLLRLDGVCSQSGSHRYGKLVDLSLTEGTITEAYLIVLLSNNPQLRALSLGLKITDISTPGVSGVLIRLLDLQVLNMGNDYAHQAWAVLQLLEPGARSLEVSMEGLYVEDFGEAACLMHSFFKNKQVREFFGRSRVTALNFDYSPDEEVTDWFPCIFHGLPHLQKLRLRGPSFLSTYEPDPKIDVVCHNLRELCLVNCELDLASLKRMLQAHSIETLRLCECDIFVDGEGLDQAWNLMETLEGELSDFVPNIEFYKSHNADFYSDPYPGWNYRFF